jgi:hypothetical protein
MTAALQIAEHPLPAAPRPWRGGFALLILFVALLLLAPAAAEATPAPAWQLSVQPFPANFAPGQDTEYLILATDTGAAPSSGPIDLSLTLPAGITPIGASLAEGDVCSLGPSLVSCQISHVLQPGTSYKVAVEVAVSAGAEGTLSAAATVSGGGAPQAATASTSTPISAAAVPFGFLPGFRALAVDQSGAPASAGGSHPSQLTADLAFPTELQGGEITPAGTPRDVRFDLPPGLIGDPAASPVLCTEAFFETRETCPAPSQVGVIDLTSRFGVPAVFGSPLYAMVPPPGAPAEFAFDAAGAGLFVHLIAGLRSDSDYGIVTTSSDILALGPHPFFGVRVQIWGDPSAAAHDHIRGKFEGHVIATECLQSSEAGTCAVAPQKIAFLSMPGSCPASRPLFEAHADSWEQPGVFLSAIFESADSEGNPVSLSGCNALEYQPTIQVSPTTDLADSPSGLEFHLHQPQEASHVEPLTGRTTAELENARLTLPAGMVTNPSQADGLDACSESEIGYLGENHYSKSPQSCPEASRLGSLEVTSPLLVQRDAEQKLISDPETGAPLPEALQGSVFLAKPFENQFGSLLAIYLAIEDPRNGIVAKLAGRVEADPGTGQLTTVFEENPQLPLEDIKLSLFKGARAPLITPPVCGAHATTSTLTPWSSPEGQDAHPQSTFTTTEAPGGGACPTSEAAAPNGPSFSAGTLTPQAGAFSPFVFKLHREDGSQRLTGIDTILPPGLSGKLAGIAQCSDAQIAQAQAREHPNMGIDERNSPSCPSSSEVGIVKVAAGAGPTPFWTAGHAYLAGPYKGAPLSLVVIAPAIAGPFDLGAVVNRVALYVNLETAQIHAVSDPFPTILEGIPLDLRTVVLEMGRPGFTLNPTNCSPMSVLGTATSALGNAASLSDPFQVGGCPALAFKPHLKISLTGGTKRSDHPALKAVLTMPPGGANIARAQVGLPHALFLDQANLNKVCVQADLRAATCPASSVYGHARAISPLLDAPLEGPVYLGVGYGHPLPDLVADLNGQIRVLLHGKVDTTKQDGIRNTFEVVPDAPVSKFTLSMKGGGKYSLIENSESLCAKPQKVSALFVAQNGKVDHLTTKIAVKCPGQKKPKRHHKRRR